MHWRWKLAQWLELKWWQHYLRHKDKSGYLAWKRAYWGSLLGRFSLRPEDFTAQHVADMGCGPAGIFILLRHSRVTALDPLINQYRKNLPFFSPDEFPWTKFCNTAMEDLVIDLPFDTIFCMNAINHVRDLDHAFTVLCRSTKKGGLLFMSVDAHNFKSFKLLFRRVPGDALHPHQLSLDEYEDQLRQNGFRVVERVLIKRGFVFSHYALKAVRQ